jgi:hypothetical protein
MVEITSRRTSSNLNVFDSFFSDLQLINLQVQGSENLKTLIYSFPLYHKVLISISDTYGGKLRTSAKTHKFILCQFPKSLNMLL